MSAAAPVLGFDFGYKRVGVAIGNRLTGTARALTTIAGGERTDWHAIGELIDHWHPAVLVVGLPTRLDDERSALTEAAERFARQLEGRFGLPVHTADERLSSLEAESRLREARAHGRKRPLRKGETDAVAAQIILETWLEQTACA